MNDDIADVQAMYESGEDAPPRQEERVQLSSKVEVTVEDNEPKV